MCPTKRVARGRPGKPAKPPTPCVPYRWVEMTCMDHAFYMLELDRMPDYGFTGVTLWTSFEQADNYVYTLPVTYRRYAKANELRDAQRIQSGADFLRDFSRRAHHHGLTVMHAYNMCAFTGPPMPFVDVLRAKTVATPLRDVYPEWFNPQGEPDFSKDGFYDFMAAEVADFFDAFPHVDGLFCWNCECSNFAPSRLRHQTVSKAEIARRAIKAVYEVCRRRGKIMTHDIHTAGANIELTKAIIAAGAECPDLILGADATYSDWHMHLDTTPWLAEMRKANRIYVGFDASGEFFGQGRTIGGWPRWITRHFGAAKAHGLSAITVRNNTIAKDNSCILLPMLELNLRLVAQLGLHGAVDLDEELKNWWKRHFIGEFPQGMKEVVLSFEAILEKSLYINGTNITEYNPDHGFPRKAMLDVPGYPCWHSEQFTRPGTPITMAMIPEWGRKSHPVEELRKEKREAIGLCDKALAKLKGIRMAAEDRDYFTRRVRQARDVAQAFLHTINVVHPLYQIVGEHYDRSMIDPRAALKEELTKFLRFADEMEQRWGPLFYRRFTPKMREFAADIPAKYYK